MREPDWFDGPERDDGDLGQGRRRWMLPLVAVPWLVVAALLVLPGRTEVSTDAEQPAPEAPPAAGQSNGQAATPPPAPEETEAQAEPGTVDGTHLHAWTDDSASSGSALPPTAVLELEELRGRWRVAPGSEEAAALAVVIARAWLTGIGPPVALEGASPDPAEYAEHLVVEAVEYPSQLTSVVTVLAVVLTNADDAEARVEARRLAVPLAITDGVPRPAGAPWMLPGPELSVTELDLEPLDDPAALTAADTALAVAGLGELTVDELRTADGWPVVATASDGEVEHTIWLRRHLDGFAVAGSTLAGAPEEEPR